MNEMKVFENPEFGEVRTIEVDGEPWFVGKDVAEVLGYTDTSQAIKKHVDVEDKLTRRFDWSGQNRNMVIINESGLHSLVLSSKLPTAKKFKRWVTSEVLPSIRKTGGYGVSSNLSLQLQVLINLEVEQQRQSVELEKVNQRIDSMGEVISLDSKTWRSESQKLIKKMAQAEGGYENIRDIHISIYDLLEARAGVNLATRLKNKKSRMALNGATSAECEKLGRLDIISADKKLVEIYLAVVKDMAVAKGVCDATETIA